MLEFVQIDAGDSVSSDDVLARLEEGDLTAAEALEILRQ